jgi:hypothetical protein
VESPHHLLDTPRPRFKSKKGSHFLLKLEAEIILPPAGKAMDFVSDRPEKLDSPLDLANLVSEKNRFPSVGSVFGTDEPSPHLKIPKPTTDLFDVGFQNILGIAISTVALANLLEKSLCKIRDMLVEKASPKKLKQRIEEAVFPIQIAHVDQPGLHVKIASGEAETF